MVAAHGGRFGDVLLQARVAAQLTQEELAARAKVAARTISDLERGKAKIPHADTVLRLARALQLTGPAMATFEAAARRRVMQPNDAADISRSSIAIPETATYLYRVRRGQASADDRRIGIITGSIRHVRDADIWVNSENTDMRMSRFEEYTISAIIRYDGARRDSAGHVVDDIIADELAHKVAGGCPVAPATAVTTGSGQLIFSNNVHHVIHAAAVYGEPGAGYRQIRDIGRCVTNALAEADRLPPGIRPTTILFPMLGMGQGGGKIEHTAPVLLGAAADYLTEMSESRLGTVWFLAHTYAELAACHEVLIGNPRFSPL